MNKCFAFFFSFEAGTFLLGTRSHRLILTFCRTHFTFWGVCPPWPQNSSCTWERLTQIEKDCGISWHCGQTAGWEQGVGRWAWQISEAGKCAPNEHSEVGQLLSGKRQLDRVVKSLFWSPADPDICANPGSLTACLTLDNLIHPFEHWSLC